MAKQDKVSPFTMLAITLKDEALKKEKAVPFFQNGFLYRQKMGLK